MPSRTSLLRIPVDFIHHTYFQNATYFGGLAAFKDLHRMSGLIRLQESVSVSTCADATVDLQTPVATTKLLTMK